MRPHLFQLFFECILLTTQQAAVDLELLLALATLLHVVLDLRQFHLQASLARVRTLAEDNQYDQNAS